MRMTLLDNLAISVRDLVEYSANPGSPFQRRLAGWTRYVFAKNRYRTQGEMADDMHSNQGHLSSIMNGKRQAGFDVALKLAQVGQLSLDTVCFRDPAALFMEMKGTP